MNKHKNTKLNMKEVFEWYAEKGWRAIPLPYMKKAPVGPGWQQAKYTVDDFNSENQNIGVILDGGLVDIDLDCPESILLSDAFLPVTGMEFGRTSTPRSHRLYQVENDVGLHYKKFQVVRDGVFHELRYSRKKDGGFSGIQTVFPGSVHPSGEEIKWHKMKDPSIVSADEIMSCCNRLAAACLLLQNYPPSGSRHDFFLALSGGLAKSGMALDSAKTLLEPVILASGDDEPGARLTDIENTYLKFSSGDLNLTGWNQATNWIDKKVLKKLGEFLSIKISYVVPRTVSGTGSSSFEAEEWTTPVSIQPIKVAPMLPEMLPEAIREYACDVAHRKNVPLDFPATALICFIGNAMGRKFSIQPKDNDYTWKEFPNLWGMIIADPSSRKSPALREVDKFVKELEGKHNEKNERAVRQFKVKCDNIKLQKKQLEKDYIVALKSGKQHEIDNVELKQIQLEKQLDSLKPKKRQYLVNDATVEKLCQILENNPFGVMMYRDELPGFLKVFKKSGYENAREFFLELWSGQGSYNKQRLTEGLDAEIKGLCCGIFGSIQPHKLAPYVNEVLSGDGSDGLLPRFQIACYPESIPSRYVNEQPNLEYEERVRNIFQTIDKFQPKIDPKTKEYIDEKFLFDYEAQQTYMDYEIALGKDKDKGFHNHAMEILKGKYTGLVSTLALIFHVIEISDGKEPGDVSKANIDMAICWCNYLESHACKIYRVSESAYSEGAKALLKMIDEGEIQSSFRASDSYKNRREFLKTKMDADPVLAELCNYGWIRKVESSLGRYSFEVHPNFDLHYSKKSTTSGSSGSFDDHLSENNNSEQILLSPITPEPAGSTEPTKSATPNHIGEKSSFGSFGSFGSFDEKLRSNNKVDTILFPSIPPGSSEPTEPIKSALQKNLEDNLSFGSFGSSGTNTVSKIIDEKILPPIIVEPPEPAEPPAVVPVKKPQTLADMIAIKDRIFSR
jgi:hypothetical protein